MIGSCSLTERATVDDIVFRRTADWDYHNRSNGRQTTCDLQSTSENVGREPAADLAGTMATRLTPTALFRC